MEVSWINKRIIKIVIPILIVLSALGLAFDSLRDMYIKSRLEAKVELNRALSSMEKITEYRYSLKSGFNVEGREEVISQVEGEKSQGKTHIKGEMVNTPVDIYYINRSIYNYDSASEKWLIIESDSSNAEELLISELNPLSNFRIRAPATVEKVGFEKINGTECLVAACETGVQSELLEKQIQMIDFKMIDLLGRWRHLGIPIGRFTPGILEHGIGFDGSNYGFAPVEKSDMIFIPDLSTAVFDPFTQVPTLSMIGDVFVISEPENYRFDQDPRAIAIKAEEYMASTGIADEIRIGPEYEFNVFDHVSYTCQPQKSSFSIDAHQAIWNSGNEEHQNLGYKIPLKGGYHIAPPQDILYDLRARMCLLMEENNIKVKYHHHEVGGPGQIEIEVEFGSLREMADKTMLAKYLIKNLAFQEGKTVTFLPKPLFGEAGNGMHVHIHLFKNGQPLFYDKNGYAGLSKEALYFIGGLLRHAPALLAITNPSTNSYKRLVPGYEAPVSICFATSNRSAVIRIPAYAKTPESKRFEFRSSDATCNPYLGFAAMLMAGLDGIHQKIDPVAEGYGPYDVNLYTLSPEEQAKIKSLPKSLDEALDALEKDHDFLLAGGVFPARLIEIWIKAKRAEAAKVNSIPHPMEFELYYDL
jgi:glutamine synthetase